MSYNFRGPELHPKKCVRRVRLCCGGGDSSAVERVRNTHKVLGSVPSISIK